MDSYLLFSTTNLVFMAEEELKKNSIECEIAPTPISGKVYCGMCVKVKLSSKDVTVGILDSNYIEIAKIVDV